MVILVRHPAAAETSLPAAMKAARMIMRIKAETAVTITRMIKRRKTARRMIHNRMTGRMRRMRWRL